MAVYVLQQLNPMYLSVPCMDIHSCKHEESTCLLTKSVKVNLLSQKCILWVCIKVEYAGNKMCEELGELWF